MADPWILGVRKWSSHKVISSIIQLLHPRILPWKPLLYEFLFPRLIVDLHVIDSLDFTVFSCPLYTHFLKIEKTGESIKSHLHCENRLNRGAVFLEYNRRFYARCLLYLWVRHFLIHLAANLWVVSTVQQQDSSVRLCVGQRMSFPDESTVESRDWWCTKGKGKVNRYIISCLWGWSRTQRLTTED